MFINYDIKISTLLCSSFNGFSCVENIHDLDPKLGFTHTKGRDTIKVIWHDLISRVLWLLTSYMFDAYTT